MAKMTDNQKEAAYTRGGDMVVTAAAGAGKTSVLVERVTDFIKNRGSLDELLIVTFTIKAAGEMRERIASALQKMLSETPDDVHIQKQSMLIHKAKICTIDAFCNDIVRKNFNLLSVSPDFSIIDDSAVSDMQEKAYEAVAEEFFENLDDRDFKFLVDTVTNDRDDRSLKTVISEYANFLNALPFKKIWIDNTAAELSAITAENACCSKVGTFFAKNLIKDLRELLCDYNRIYASLLSFAENDEWYNKYAALYTAEIALIKEIITLLHDKNAEKAVEISKSYAYINNPAWKGTEDLKAECQDARKRFKEILGAVTEFSSKKIYNDARDTLRLFGALNRFTEKYFKHINEQKQKADRYTFSDVAKMALSLLWKEQNGILQRTDTAKEIKDTYKEILLDEYQDTSDIQELIFRAISDNNTFVVGDSKQSIYGFRNAKVSLFEERKKSASYTGFPRLVNLSYNFRSRPEVVNFVNKFFDATMQKEFGGVDYEGGERLVCGRNEEIREANKTEIYIADSKSLSDDDEDDKAAFEAKISAAKAAELINSGFKIFDKDLNAERKLLPSDIAVLLRGRKHFKVFEKEFKKLGMQVNIESNENIAERYEIACFINLLTVIDNPYNDIAMTAVLRSPFFAFDADSLLLLRKNRKISIYEALLNSNEQKCRNFIEKLERYRLLKNQYPVYRLLLYICSDTAATAIFKEKAQRQNISRLLNFAKSFEEGESLGLYGFLRSFSGSFEGESGEGKEGVSVMTMHKSKGLEFPVVIVSGLGTQYGDVLDVRKKMLLDTDYGIGFKLKDKSGCGSYRSKQFECIIENENNLLVSEELRLLYVAFTRAREKLIVVASVGNARKKYAEIRKRFNRKGKLSAYYLAKLKHPKDVLLSGVCENIPHDYIECDDYKLTFLDELPEQKTVSLPNEEKHGISESVLHRFSFNYPYEKYAAIPAKVSVSEFKEYGSEDSLRMWTYDPLSEEKITDKVSAAEIGTAYHILLEKMDFSKKYTDDELSKLIESLAGNGTLDKKAALKIDREKILSFVKSPLYEQMSQYECKKEYRFACVIPAHFYTDRKLNFDFERDGDMILMQGAVDCFFDTPDGIIIVDYKTDRVKNGDELVYRYKSQLILYAIALSRTLGKKIKSAFVYSLALGKIIEIDIEKETV